MKIVYTFFILLLFIAERASVKHISISKEFIKTLLPENPVIVEAGAHRGRDTIKLAKLFPLGTIHAFEPIRSLFSELQEKIVDYPHIVSYNYALGSSTGMANIYISSGTSDAARSLLKPELYSSERPGVLFNEENAIVTMTLDDWAASNNIKHVDFMWLDMQGYEYAALSAGPKILSTVSLIHTEVNYTQRYAGHPLFSDYKNWLELQGFSLILEAQKTPTWGNALFQRMR